MTSKLTRERLGKIKSWRETYGAGSNVMLPAEEAEELASIALAAMDSKPVALHMGEAINVFKALKGEKLSERVTNADTGLMGASNVQVWTSKIGCALEFISANGGCTLNIFPQPSPLVPDEMTPEQAHEIGDYYGEPVALQLELAKVIYHFRDWNEGFPVERFKADYVISWMLANYPPAQPASEREQVRREHAEWSQSTFGNVGPIGPLKHLSKEALEAAEQPGDLSEWADMQFLLWDAQRRAGVTDEQITQAMIDKLAVNKQREWPEPKDGEPRLHIKSQPATQEVKGE